MTGEKKGRTPPPPTPCHTLHLGHGDDGEVVQHSPCHHGHRVGLLAEEFKVALGEESRRDHPVNDERVGNADQHSNLRRGEEKPFQLRTTGPSDIASLHHLQLASKASQSS